MNLSENALGLCELTEYIIKAFNVEHLPSRRNLSLEEIKKLQTACSLAFNTEIHSEIIEKIMHYCYFVERTMKGRAAGNIEDMVIRYLLRYFASLNSSMDEAGLNHVEVGALFGAATIFSCHATKLAGKNIPTLVIDPFEGYYGQEVDPFTKHKVDEDTFWSNLECFGYSEEDAIVFKGMSDDQKVINKVGNIKILSLIIDGDHSYEGVKKDWINYSQLVVPGGYVLFDDFNSNSWADVTEFVNKEVLSNLMGEWEVILAFGSSLILKRTDFTAEDKSRYIAQLLCEIKGKEKSIERINSEKDEQIKQKDEQIKQKDEQIKQKNKQIQAMQNTLSWKLTAPLRRMGQKLLERN